MIGSRALGLGVFGAVISIAAVQGQTGGHYRDFQLGGDLASVAALSGVPASEAKTLHARPVLLQELEWRRPYVASSEAGMESVQRIAFSFYDDQLFRLVIDYDRDRTEGMTDADMVEAISGIYGTPLRPALKASRPTDAFDGEPSGTRIGRWGDGEYTVVVYRSSYASGFQMVVTESRLSALARRAEAQALRLDERDAPQRERARQKREADAEQATKAKARLANKASFKP